MSKKRTEKEKQEMFKLSEVNNKLRWFCVEQPFKIFDRVLRIGWYEMTGSTFTESNNWVHYIKLRGTKNNIRISDVDYKRIIKAFPEKNEHLEKTKSN
jgi:hypothetical protein